MVSVVAREVRNKDIHIVPRPAPSSLPTGFLQHPSPAPPQSRPTPTPSRHSYWPTIYPIPTTLAYYTSQPSRGPSAEEPPPRRVLDTCPSPQMTSGAGYRRPMRRQDAGFAAQTQYGAHGFCSLGSTRVAVPKREEVLPLPPGCLERVCNFAAFVARSAGKSSLGQHGRRRGRRGR